MSDIDFLMPDTWPHHGDVLYSYFNGTWSKHEVLKVERTTHWLDSITFKCGETKHPHHCHREVSVSRPRECPECFKP